MLTIRFYDYDNNDDDDDDDDDCHLSFDDDDDDDVDDDGIASIVDNRHDCNVNYLTTVIMLPLCIYTLLIGHYGSVINDGNVDGNKISESDDIYDYHTCTNATRDDHGDGYTMVF